MFVTYGRSTTEIAEDLLLEAATAVFNVSMAKASAMQFQRRELGLKERLQAEALLNIWEGTLTQMKQASELAMLKKFAISRQF